MTPLGWGVGTGDQEAEAEPSAGRAWEAHAPVSPPAAAGTRRAAAQREEQMESAAASGPSSKGGEALAAPATPAATSELLPRPALPPVSTTTTVATAPTSPLAATAAPAGAVQQARERAPSLPPLRSPAPQPDLPSSRAQAAGCPAHQLDPPKLVQAYCWEAAHGPLPSWPPLLSPLALPVEPAAPNPPQGSFPAGAAPTPPAAGAPAAAAAGAMAVSPKGTPAAMEGGMTPTQAAVARLEELGARRGRIVGGAAAEGGAAAAVEGEGGVEVGAPPEPKQGERVQVERLPLGSMAPAAAAGGMQQLEVRPEHEARPMTSAEVAGMKSREHAIQAGEREQVMHAKQSELHQLRGQAELLEVQSQGLLAQASHEKLKRDQMRRRKGQFELVEWRHYAEAEQAEKERRKVVEAARPLAVRAEESELEAMRLRQLAADTEFHGEVLERKARALVQESMDMTELAQQRMMDAELLSAELFVKRQEQQEWQQKVDLVSAGDLPRYIHECEVEIGRLAHRITELREEASGLLAAAGSSSCPCPQATPAG
ncbi:hypothetical protein CHLNCDRAFT_138307 [Chlorella variabilis]|uniref:Uncharacterized protein n=1 Tax=Chlorella variabilis TaxID=554065 RepID=E1ZMR6_CHLVA|nr:hypothetical protein CHLNCDRAFT_138307 [Chlorella variabilis]EFN52738.1 hypothetical protein CHLNCDRAFT_138307 [Chlorella variabilis]|eukprot:XP_005844840.1 hypothetical protein CHLNCDRAFT_138307 [Chlorella variabilis]